jgi:hypothetical protein
VLRSRDPRLRTDLRFVTLEQLTSDGPYAPVFISANEPEQCQDWLGNTAIGRSEIGWPLPTSRPSLVEQGFTATR